MISVLVTFYNASILEIDRCLDSIFFQSSKLFECIVLDDNSEINQEYLKEKCKNYNFKLIKNASNLGVMKSRNKLIDVCNSTYFTFVDGDDFIEQSYIQVISTKLGKADLIFFRMKKSNGKLTKKYKKKSANMRIESTATCEKCYRTSMIKEKSIYFIEGPHSYEDMYFSFKAYYYAVNFAYINKGYLYNYVYRKESASNTATNSHRIEAAFYYFEKLSKELNLSYSHADMQFIYLLIFPHLIIKSFLKRNYDDILKIYVPLKINFRNGFVLLIKTTILKIIFQIIKVKGVKY